MWVFDCERIKVKKKNIYIYIYIYILHVDELSFLWEYFSYSGIFQPEVPFNLNDFDNNLS